jgi:hypothetical protein
MTASRFPFGHFRGLRWEIGTNGYFMESHSWWGGKHIKPAARRLADIVPRSLEPPDRLDRLSLLTEPRRLDIVQCGFGSLRRKCHPIKMNGVQLGVPFGQYRNRVAAFRKGLHDLGCVEGRNNRIEGQ